MGGERGGWGNSALVVGGIDAPVPTYLVTIDRVGFTVGRGHVPLRFTCCPPPARFKS